MKPRSLQVALVGLGTVGTGVAQILRGQADRLAARAGAPMQLRHVIVRDSSRRRDIVLPESMISTDFNDALSDPDVNVVVELMGGTDLARQHVRAALEAGKDVVTANKALLCVHGEELFGLARNLGRTIGFEAAVAGGVPIIAGLGQSLASNRVLSIEAILNGTSNYILSTMAATGQVFAEVVREAQALGYAEADPTMDIDGTDAAQKLAILTRLAFGTAVQPSDFIRQGIDSLEAADIAYARELGYAIKLLAVAKLSSGKLELHVQPTLVRKENPIAQIDGARNMIGVVGDSVGAVWWAGPGAGRSATASAVVADLIDLASGRAAATFPRLNLWPDSSSVPLLPIDEIRRRSYLRFRVEDRPHVVADIADVLGRHQISLASIIQHESPELAESEDASPPTDEDKLRPNDSSGEVDSGVTGQSRSHAYPIVPLVVMTHRTTEGQLRAAERELHNLSALHGDWVRMPVAD